MARNVLSRTSSGYREIARTRPACRAVLIAWRGGEWSNVCSRGQTPRVGAAAARWLDWKRTQPRWSFRGGCVEVVDQRVEQIAGRIQAPMTNDGANGRGVVRSPGSTMRPMCLVRGRHALRAVAACDPDGPDSAVEADRGRMRSRAVPSTWDVALRGRPRGRGRNPFCDRPVGWLCGCSRRRPVRVGCGPRRCSRGQDHADNRGVAWRSVDVFARSFVAIATLLLSHGLCPPSQQDGWWRSRSGVDAPGSFWLLIYQMARWRYFGKRIAPPLTRACRPVRARDRGGLVCELNGHAPRRLRRRECDHPRRCSVKHPGALAATRRAPRMIDIPSDRRVVSAAGARGGCAVSFPGAASRRSEQHRSPDVREWLPSLRLHP